MFADPSHYDPRLTLSDQFTHSPSLGVSGIASGIRGSGSFTRLQSRCRLADTNPGSVSSLALCANPSHFVAERGCHPVMMWSCDWSCLVV